MATLKYTYTTLNVPDTATATGINDSGDVVGSYFDVNTFTGYGFLYSGSTYTILDGPTGATSFSASGINDSGEVIGFYSNSSNQTISCFYEGGNYTPITGPAGSINTYAMGISDNGNYVGYYEATDTSDHAFVYSGGNYNTLSGPTGATTTYAYGVNDSGDVAGSYETNNTWYGFVDHAGSYITLNPKGSIDTQVNGINNDGDIIGSYEKKSGKSGKWYGFIATIVNGAPVYELISSPKGATENNPDCISNVNSVAGTSDSKKGPTHNEEGDEKEKGKKKDAFEVLPPVLTANEPRWSILDANSANVPLLSGYMAGFNTLTADHNGVGPTANPLTASQPTLLTHPAS